MTEFELFQALRPLYPAREYALLPQTANGTGMNCARHADALALCLWPSRGLYLSGFEMKSYRGDWLRELKDPEKAEEIAKFCVGVDTRALTKDLRWVRTGDLRVGDELVGFEECAAKKRAARRWCPSVVTGHSIERRSVFRIVLGNGTELIATPEHQWIAANAPVGHSDPVLWMTTEQIARRIKRANGRVFLPRYFTPWPTRTDYSAGFLAGAFDGEGCLSVPTKAWRLQFSQRPNELLAVVRNALTANNFEVWDYPNRSTSTVRILVVNGGIPEIARFLGQMRPPSTSWGMVAAPIGIHTGNAHADQGSSTGGRTSGRARCGCDGNVE